MKAKSARAMLPARPCGTLSAGLLTAGLVSSLVATCLLTAPLAALADPNTSDTIFCQATAYLLERDDRPASETGLFGSMGFEENGIVVGARDSLPGACCFQNAPFCRLMTEEECSAAGGWAFYGAGTSCSFPGICYAWGACCMPSGYCTYTTDEDCATYGGIFNSDVGCATNPCALGACCWSDGGCLQLQEIQCHGSWMEGIPCDPTPCSPVPAVRTTWGRIKETYRKTAR